jgi:hypothetical protein
MHLGDRVLFPGYLTDAELSALITNCSGMVFASLHEGFGLPVIEAMAAGIPVACSNITSLPEVVGDAALLFDPRVPMQISEAIICLVEDEPLRMRLIQAGLERAAEFSNPERMAGEYLEAFQYALNNESQVNLLTGAYPDGWVGPILNIHVARAAKAQSLEVELFAPAWLPHSKLSAHASRGGKPQGVALEIARGSQMLWTIPLDHAGGYYEIEIAPTFVPASSENSDDQRELSGMLQRCGIVCVDGKRIELFPEQVAA